MDKNICPNCEQIETRRDLGNCMLSSCSVCGYQSCPLCGSEIYEEYCIPCVAHMKKDNGIHAVGMCSECTIKKYEKVVGKYWNEKISAEYDREAQEEVNSEFDKEINDEFMICL